MGFIFERAFKVIRTTYNEKIKGLGRSGRALIHRKRIGTVVSYGDPLIC